MRQTQTVYRLTDSDFQAALKLLRSGRLPGNMISVAAHVRGTVKELVEYTETITECAVRLNNNNSVLADILEKSGVKYEKGPDGPYITMKEDYK